MKKVLAIILTAVLVLSCNMTAFANISGLDKDGKLISSSPVGDAQYVIANGGDKLEVTDTVDTPATVTAHPSVEAYTGGVIEIANDVIQKGTMVAIHAYDENTSVTVGGSVKGENVEATATTAYVNNGGALSVSGNVENKSGGHAIKASTSSRATVGGSIQESGAGNAIIAESGASVTVDGNVTEEGDGHAIEATGTDTTVTVKGDVTEEGNGNAIYAKTGATVLVFGKVTGKDGGVAINADGGQVTVGGDVTSSIQARDNGDYSASVLIEGVVTGDIGAVNDSSIHLGQLDGTAAGMLSNIHYLIGTDVKSKYDLSAVTLKSDIVAGETIDGVKKEGYRYTTTADSTVLNGKTIVLKSNDSSKTLEVTGLPEKGVDDPVIDPTTGAVTLTLNGDFKGGLQNLILTLKDIIYDIFVDTDGNGNASSNPTQGAKGTSVDLTATANDKYEFDYWEVVSGNITIDNNRFNIGTENVEIKAHFKEVQQPSPKKQTSGSTKTLFTGTTGNPVTNGSWTKNADGTWTYATAYKFSNTWGYIANPNDANSAAWYYFDRNGNMLTGWQKLYWNGAYRWYYFSQTKDSNEGKCQLGGITPDGYRVGADGAWIED